ncbi:hypothetical protein [Pseudoduganella lutea]|uniref:Uncharacterized protein n=1 Tax=Pseudoduganella lutea TaxID=321985 RepID=A0A4P6KX39_9BURK|nr:hypothetical protein [Pseudoduganella lutea]QBE63536.1 hypothetical protein EWM63_11600 [Pseudoduganella lutea]
MTLPTRPSNWQDFERLSTALASEVYKTRFRRWGSAGQRKNGVDAWATTPDGRAIALRFEGRTERYGQPLAKTDIDAALAEAAGFPNKVDEFVLLAAGADDAAVQAYAAELTASRTAAGQSSIMVWGWQSIATHIGQQPKVQRAFYGHEVKSSSKFKLVLLAAALIVVAGGVGSLFLGKNAIDASNAKPKDPTVNVGNIAANLDELNETYQQCQALLAKNVFTFSHELAETCRDPATAQLAALSKKVEKHRSGFDAQAKIELERLLAIFREDVRETAAVTSAAHAFDSAVVQSMKDGCAAGKPAADNTAMTRAGAAAVVAQVRYYFLLKDFIIPELATAKEILQLHGSGAPAPERMTAAAGRMEQLLKERVAYAVKETRSPFTLSSVKHTVTRDAVPDTDAAAEEARWRDVLAQSSTQSLWGRTRDIEALVSCGALNKEQAAALAPPAGT